jgi:hypothetical protein
MADIVLAISQPGHVRHRTFRHNLANENDAPAISLGVATPDIEAKIDLFEFVVERDRKNPEQLGMEKAETDEADVYPAPEGIQFGAVRDVSYKEAGIHFVVQHHEVPPFGGEEDALTRHAL